MKKKVLKMSVVLGITKPKEWLSNTDDSNLHLCLSIKKEKRRERKRDSFSEVISQTITHSCRINSHLDLCSSPTEFFNCRKCLYHVVSHIVDAQQIFIRYYFKGLNAIKYKIMKCVSG